MEFVVYEQKGAVGIVTISREKALNALNSTVLEELDATFDAINLDEVRCVILTGAGQKSFVAGADIGEMSSLTKPSSNNSSDRFVSNTTVILLSFSDTFKPAISKVVGKVRLTDLNASFPLSWRMSAGTIPLLEMG